MNNYLDINKSVMISAPAGSGKTEKLARRYIALLKAGVPVERILAITFTEKAAAEMKQRILNILKREDPELFAKTIHNMPLMRVSTIHAFCGSMLRRFSHEAGIDPHYSIAGEGESDIIWDEVIHDVLMEFEGDTSSQEFILETLGEKGFRGFDYLRDTLYYLYDKAPFSMLARPFLYEDKSIDSIINELIHWPGAEESIKDYREIIPDPGHEGWYRIKGLFLTGKGLPRKRKPREAGSIQEYEEWAERMHELWRMYHLREFGARAERLKNIFDICISRYMERKRQRGILDFDDLEYLTYTILTDHPEWANILYEFDERTDHILVDEFQDTNTLQWSIINKLTEEWRAGIGAKRDEGIRPTIFLVGDDKQSIYFFRGANVELFHRSREQLKEWLGDEFYYEEIRENYRSHPAIIEFTNRVFSRIMSAHETEPWKSRYIPFNHSRRSNVPQTGKVEIIILEERKPVSEAKEAEADILGKRIRSLVGDYSITDRDTGNQRPCMYSDIAVLIRKRTHLRAYEEALRKYGIPYITVKGVGFYQEPEVAMLRALITFLSNPGDDYSLYIVLKSPLFEFREETILKLLKLNGSSLFERLKNAIESEEFSQDESNRISMALSVLDDLFSSMDKRPLSELIEETLLKTQAWRYFHDAQKRENIKKFIRIIEDLQQGGRSIHLIRDYLERTLNRSEEPKANVNTDQMDAVRIMTIHSAKGLEFPVVFLPGLEERFKPSSEENLVFEREDGVYYKSIGDSSLRNIDPDYIRHFEREVEEMKRLFYVAVTRASDVLILMGQWEDSGKSFFSFLVQGLGIDKEDIKRAIGPDIPGFSILTEDDVNMIYEHTSLLEIGAEKRPRPEVKRHPVRKRIPWQTVTESAEIMRHHGRDWLILGEVIHRLLEEISRGRLRETSIGSVIKKWLIQRGMERGELNRAVATILTQIETLREKGVWDEIVLPRDDAYTELPFIYDAGECVYTGRIDRIIMEKDTCHIYDYKTFPVNESEIPYLLREYSHQLRIYRDAAHALFKRPCRSYIIFTHSGEIREVI